MTTETSTDQQLPLPGLTPPAGKRGVAPSPLEVAVHRTVVALEASDRVAEVDAVTLQLMVELAEVITSMKHRNRTSTIDKTMRLLWELKESLAPTDVEDGEESTMDAQLAAAVDAWSAAFGEQPVPGAGDGT